MTKERIYGIFEALLYLKSIAEEENELELAEKIQRLSEFVFCQCIGR